MLLKDNFPLDLKMIIDLYNNKLLSNNIMQCYLEKYLILFNRYKIYLNDIYVVDSDLKIQQLIIASTILELKIGLYKPINPLVLELSELKNK